jgi:hypothetical protein
MMVADDGETKRARQPHREPCATRHHDKLQKIAFSSKLVFTSPAAMNEAQAGRRDRKALRARGLGRKT